jgi:hypothetical protein
MCFVNQVNEEEKKNIKKKKTMSKHIVMSKESRIRFEPCDARAPILPNKFVLSNNNIDDDTKLQSSQDVDHCESFKYKAVTSTHLPINAFNFKPTIIPKISTSSMVIPPFVKKTDPIVIQEQEVLSELPIPNVLTDDVIRVKQVVDEKKTDTVDEYKKLHVETTPEINDNKVLDTKLSSEINDTLKENQIVTPPIFLNELEEYHKWVQANKEETNIRNELLSEAEFKISNLTQKNHKLESQIATLQNKNVVTLDFTGYGVVFVIGMITWYVVLLF